MYVALARLSTCACAHLAEPDSMTESLAFKNPKVSIAMDAEKAGGENCATTLEQPTDFVCFCGEISVVCRYFERVDATAFERVQNADGMNA